jgi:hypothetical protein
LEFSELGIYLRLIFRGEFSVFIELVCLSTRLVVVAAFSWVSWVRWICWVFLVRVSVWVGLDFCLSWLQFSDNALNFGDVRNDSIDSGLQGRNVLAEVFDQVS